nr:unnamed protein product [Digitaria exilis]
MAVPRAIPPAAMSVTMRTTNWHATAIASGGELVDLMSSPPASTVDVVPFVRPSLEIVPAEDTLDRVLAAVRADSARPCRDGAERRRMHFPDRPA